MCSSGGVMMARVLDLVALRSFVAVADSGGVTRAAGLLNLTQSAVSMQVKRLEESLDLGLFARAARKLTLTPEGEQLLAYARRMLALNDEVLARLAALYPRVRVTLASSFTVLLRQGFARGEYDVILTTEDVPGAGAEVLGTRDLVWVGAEDGQAWQKRPLRLGFKDSCVFRPKAIAALEAAGIAWDLAVDGESEPAIEATVAADLAVSARLTNAMPQGLVPIEARGALPELGQQSICLYAAPTLKGEPAEALLAQLRQAYCF